MTQSVSPESSENIESTENTETKETPDTSREDNTNGSASNESNDSTEDDGQRSSRFTEGQELTFIRVRFPGNAKSFPFLLGKRSFRYGQTVVAMSDRGMAVGYINSFPYTKEYTSDMGQIRSIAHFASREDIEKEQDLIDKEKKAEELCLRLIEKHSLNMVLTHVQYIQYGKKAVFYFTAPARVDFRELVKDLVGDLKMRIELRQISVRDRAAALGAVGACGLQTCCSSFLQRYGQVSMKMAKNQNLALVPSKINGVCGQVKCCIRYEDDVYAEKRKLLPPETTILKAANGDIGRVYRLHLIIEQFEMMTTSGARRRYARNMFENGEVLKDYDFPESFKHVVDETKEVIGFLTEEEEHEMRMAKFEEEDDDDETKTSSEENSSSDEGSENSKQHLSDNAPAAKVEQPSSQAENEAEEEDEDNIGNRLSDPTNEEASERAHNPDQKNNRPNNRNRNRNNRNRNSGRNNNRRNNNANNNNENGNSNQDGERENNRSNNRNRNNRNRNRNNKNRNRNKNTENSAGANRSNSNQEKSHNSGNNGGNQEG